MYKVLSNLTLAVGSLQIFIQLIPNTVNPSKRQSRLQQTTNFATSFLIFEKNKVWYFMRILCQQTILVKYHALFVTFEKAANMKLSSAAYYRWRFMG